MNNEKKTPMEKSFGLQPLITTYNSSPHPKLELEMDFFKKIGLVPIL